MVVPSLASFGTRSNCVEDAMNYEPRISERRQRVRIAPPKDSPALRNVEGRRGSPRPAVSAHRFALPDRSRLRSGPQGSPPHRRAHRREHPSGLRRSGFHLAMRRGRKIAKVAMARKLAVQLYCMWRLGWDYGQLKSSVRTRGARKSR